MRVGAGGSCWGPPHPGGLPVLAGSRADATIWRHGLAAAAAPRSWLWQTAAGRANGERNKAPRSPSGQNKAPRSPSVPTPGEK